MKPGSCEAPPALLRTDWAAQNAYRQPARSWIDTLQRGCFGDERERDALLAAGLAQLRERLWASAYYRDVLPGAGLTPRDLSLDALGHFPVLERERLAQRSLQLACPGDPAGEFWIRSSGSTGQPVEVMRNDWECLEMWPVLSFLARDIGRVTLAAKPRVTLLCTLPGGLEYHGRLPLFGEGQLTRISTRRPEAAARLRESKPHVITGDPTGLHWLASLDDRPNPCVIFSSAQYLPAAYRHELDAPIVNYYATTETGPIAWECMEHAGRFHVLAPRVHVESEQGRLYVTRLTDSPFPLLRYAPGDSGTVRRVDPCCCGARGQVIEGFTGRRAALFVAPDGNRVDAWQLAPLFKRTALSGFQLAQVGPSRFRLALDRPNPGLRSSLVSALQRLGWPQPQVEWAALEPDENRPLKPEPFVLLRAT